jgi:hypothetical protein
MKCYQLYDRFIANRDRLLDKVWLANFLDPHCFSKTIGKTGSAMHIRQNPIEFAEFLVFMGNLKASSYLEIGILRGGSWFAADSYLRAINQHYSKTVGYDRSNHLIDWHPYQERFQSIEFRHQDSASINLESEQFDIAFIDANHTEENVSRDFEKIKFNCRFVALHDIVLPTASVGKAWSKIKNSHQKWWELIDRAIPHTCGIGIVQLF